MSNLFDEVKSQINGKNKSIVFPEGLDERVLTAASKLGTEGVLNPIVIGDKDAVQQKASELNVDLSATTVLDPNSYEKFDDMVQAFVERRKGKATEEDARKMLVDENYFGTMLVYMNEADGLVSGAAHSTADTVRPALQIIKTKEGVKKTSGVFIMVRGDEKYVFLDCAINITPDSNDLAKIAVESAVTAKLFGVDPKVAMLSFSTKGSAKSPETEKVVEALQIAKEKDPSLVIDGEFQFDAAFVPSVAAKKRQMQLFKGMRTYLFSQV